MTDWAKEINFYLLAQTSTHPPVKFKCLMMDFAYLMSFFWKSSFFLFSKCLLCFILVCLSFSCVSTFPFMWSMCQVSSYSPLSCPLFRRVGPCFLLCLGQMTDVSSRGGLRYFFDCSILTLIWNIIVYVEKLMREIFWFWALWEVQNGLEFIVFLCLEWWKYY